MKPLRDALIAIRRTEMFIEERADELTQGHFAYRSILSMTQRISQEVSRIRGIGIKYRVLADGVIDEFLKAYMEP